MRTVYAQKNKKIILGRQGEDKAVRVVWPGIVSDWSSLYGDGSFQLSVRRFGDENAYPVVVEVNGDDISFTVTSAETAIAGIGKCELTYIANGTIAKSATWETVVLNSLTGQTPSEPPEEPAKSWFTAIQGQIGDLADLETEAKNNLVAAINEAAQTGSGGANIALRVEGGYIQYTVDGITWSNLIAVADLKGAQGDTGKEGSPGKDGVDGITPTIGDNGNWYIGSTDTGKPSRGVAGATGAAGPAGKDGRTPVKGVDYWTAADKSEIVEDTAAAIDLTAYAKTADVPTKTSELENDSGFVAASELAAGLANKQDIISDLATIRSGAAKGATALQSVPSSYRTAEAQDAIDAGKQNTLIQSGAAIGQIAKITAVDDSGKPTAWEAVDMPSGGGGSIPKPLTYDYMPEGYPTKSVQTITLMEEQQVAFKLNKGVYAATITDAFEVVEGQTYTVNWDGTEYECVGAVFNSRRILGNLSIVSAGDDTGEPFLCIYNISESICQFVTTDTSASHTICVKTTGEIVTPIAEEFIPSKVTAVIENAATKENPVFTGSFSQNRQNNTTVGDYSFAEGQNTTASGVSSHAEGTICTASGDSSHAEGFSCTASGASSHAEGDNCTASGWYTHAEGESCTAQGKNQHVQGKYNIVSGTSESAVDSDYSHIVGNGTSDSERSNAHTLTWSGVPWYQGRPQFGGTAMDNGSQTVMANGDKEIILASSTANSTKKFKITVDDSGTITATEVI